jgi:hypothetical protein
VVPLVTERPVWADSLGAALIEGAVDDLKTADMKSAAFKEAKSFLLGTSKGWAHSREVAYSLIGVPTPPQAILQKFVDLTINVRKQQ